MRMNEVVILFTLLVFTVWAQTKLAVFFVVVAFQHRAENLDELHNGCL